MLLCLRGFTWTYGLSREDYAGHGRAYIYGAKTRIINDTMVLTS